MANEYDRKYTGKPPSQDNATYDVQKIIEECRGEYSAVEKEHRNLREAHGYWEHDLDSPITFGEGNDILDA